MNNRKKALLCLSLLTSTILGSALLGGSSAWADRDDWGPRGYFRRPSYNQGYWGGYRPHYGYANPWGGGWGGRGWDRGWGGYRGCGWNRGGWGGRGWGGGWGGYHGRRGWW